MLHKRIESRLKKIIDDGLVDETRKILQTYNIKTIIQPLGQSIINKP
jgi:tRNA A37 N6-isopentenylltransferase MiaA